VNCSLHFRIARNPPIPRAATAHGAWGGTRPTAGASKRPTPRKAVALKPRQAVERGSTSNRPGVSGNPKRDTVPSISSTGWKAKRVSESGPTPKIPDRKMEYTRGPEKPKPLRTNRKVNRVMRVRSWAAAFIVASSLGAGSGQAAGQEGPFAFQIRGGVTVPLEGFRDDARGWEETAGGGPSLGMGFTFPLFRFVGGYLGFSQHRFGCDEDVCQEGKEWVSTGFDFALRVVLGHQTIRPWIQGGLNTPRIEGRIPKGGRVQRLTSSGGVGYEVGGGLLVKVGERMSLSPGVRYGSAEVPFHVQPTMELRYLVVDLGLVVGF
jgi:hypothetical protein